MVLFCLEVAVEVLMSTFYACGYVWVAATTTTRLCLYYNVIYLQHSILQCKYILLGLELSNILKFEIVGYVQSD